MGLTLRRAAGMAGPMLIYKIFRSDELAQLDADGQTGGAPIDLTDGFIHFSTAEQAAETAAKHFAGTTGLWLLAVLTAPLGDDLRWEVSRGGQLFPHLYRELRAEDVLWRAELPLEDGKHRFPAGMAVDRYVDPKRHQFDRFKGLGRDHAIDMLNLVRFRGDAAYPAGHALARQGLTGAEAYRQYGADSGPVFARVGGRIVWRGSFETVLMGPAGEHWDTVFVARYPSAHAFLEMVTDPAYRAAVVHRQAAVLTSRLIRCRVSDLTDGFA